MQEMPQTRELAAFVAVVEDGGIAAAARRLDLSPSTVSRMVTALEETLGVVLLRRTTRQVALTAEGAEVLQQARRILETMEGMLEVHASAQRPRGRLRVNAAVPFMLLVVAPLLPEFHRRYPEIEVALTASDMLVNLIGDHVDVALRIGRLPDSELLARPLGTASWHVVASPAYLDEVGMPEDVGDLAGLKQVGFLNPTSNNDWRFTGAAEPVRLPLAAVADNGETVRRLVLAGLGLGRFSDFMCREDLRTGRLIEVLPGRVADPPQPVHAVYAARASTSRRLAVFLDYLSEKLG